MRGLRRARRAPAASSGLGPQGAPIAAAAAIVLACSGQAIVVAEEQARPSGDGAAAGAGDAGGAPAREPGVGRPAVCPASPAERRRLLGCWPTRHVGTWLGFFLGIPRYETADGAGAEFPPGDVALRLGVDGRGTLRVGAREAGDAPACAQQRAGCARVGALLAGFEYELDELQLADADETGAPAVQGGAPQRIGEHMSFQVRLGEPWQPWCEPLAPTCSGAECGREEPRSAGPAPSALVRGTSELPCRCSGERCAIVAPALTLELTMSEDGQALRGSYRPRGPGLPPVRLELAREPGP